MMLLLMLISVTILNVLCESNFVGKESEDVESEILENAVQNSTSDKKLRRNVGNKHDAGFRPNEYCRRFKTCAECTQTPLYNCDWCHNFGCTHIAVKLCPRAAKRVDGLEVSDLCPKIKYNRILISYGIKANIKIKLRAPDPILYDKEVVCQVQLGNSMRHLKALIIGEVIYCYPIFLDEKYQNKTTNGSLQIIWGGMEPFSNKVPLTVYQCETLATDCDSCSEIPHDYGCGWCPSIHSCVIGEKCTRDIMQWTLNRVSCNNKRLRYI